MAATNFVSRQHSCGNLEVLVESASRPPVPPARLGSLVHTFWAGNPSLAGGSAGPASKPPSETCRICYRKQDGGKDFLHSLRNTVLTAVLHGETHTACSGLGHGRTGPSLSSRVRAIVVIKGARGFPGDRRTRLLPLIQADKRNDGQAPRSLDDEDGTAQPAAPAPAGHPIHMCFPLPRAFDPTPCKPEATNQPALAVI